MDKQKKFGLSALKVALVKEKVTMCVMDESLDHGVCEDETTAHFRETVRAELIQQLGLSRDASDEEIGEALDAKREEKHAAIEAAVESGDYEAWKKNMGETPIGERIASTVTRNKFPKYREMQEYLEKAKKIAEELGLPPLGRLRRNKQNCFRASTLAEF